MKRVVLVPNNLYENAVESGRELASWLDERGYDVEYAPTYGFSDTAEMDGVDLVISLGGDGTLLRAARIVGDSEVPILGLSFGHLGFLTCDQKGRDVYQTVAAALSGELHLSKRAMLHVDVHGIAEDGEFVDREAFALNEVVLARGASGKMVEFDVDANGYHIDRLRGDGFVVATATGSTGYALSAGGPIVTPDFNGLVCVPIAPHTITARAFMTSASDVVELSVMPERSADRCLFADGEALCADLTPLKLRIRRSDFSAYIYTSGRDDFYGLVSRVFYGNVR